VVSKISNIVSQSGTVNYVDNNLRGELAETGGHSPQLKESDRAFRVKSSCVTVFIIFSMPCPYHKLQRSNFRRKTRTAIDCGFRPPAEVVEYRQFNEIDARTQA